MKEQHTSQEHYALQKTVKEIYFENGVPGFQQYKNFHVRDFENEIYHPLKLMTSVDFPGLTFILYPHVNGNSEISPHLKGNLLELSGLVEGAGEVYTIVRVQEPNGHLYLTTNLKAPIVIDAEHKKGWQHILSDNDLSLSYPLENFSAKLREKRALKEKPKGSQ